MLKDNIRPLRTQDERMLIQPFKSSGIETNPSAVVDGWNPHTFTLRFPGGRGKASTQEVSE